MRFKSAGSLTQTAFMKYSNNCSSFWISYLYERRTLISKL